MNGRAAFVLTLLSLLLWLRPSGAVAQSTIFIEPGDHWPALAWRFGIDAAALRASTGEINPYRQPPIGSTLSIVPERQRGGTAVSLKGANLVKTALRYNISPHQLATLNEIQNPYAPHTGTLFVPTPDGMPRLYPPGFSSLELSQAPGAPGQAVGWRGEIEAGLEVVGGLNGRSITPLTNNNKVLGLTGTGAFQGSGDLRLDIQTDLGFWSQPWRFVDKAEWSFQQLTLTGDAALIDQASIAAERERLFEIWRQVTPRPLFKESFKLPIADYLTLSSNYGARRSYNGGPYRTYHEGVDFSAYGGTAVTAPAGGVVVLSEFLYVRGGAVIIDHGLGIYSGYYHLKSLAVSPGDTVQPGALLGEVGTTGLSTGNHLHWDLLVDGIWVDALAWREQRMDEWILAGWGYASK